MKWFKQLFSRRRLYGDLSEEIREHLEEKIEELVAGGMLRKEAVAAARREFGNVTLVEEDSREVWRWQWIENLLMDLHYGLRMLRRNPGFTLVIVLTLALGIGANAAIFSVIDTVLLKTLPVSHPEELVSLRWESPHHEATETLPYPMFAGLREDNKAFAGMFGFHSLRLATSVDGKPGLAAGQLVSGDFFSVLGLNTILGRHFTAEEDVVPGGAPFAVISYGYWKRQFGLDPSVVGKPIGLNGVPFTIIGVTPPDFVGLMAGDSTDIWVPLQMQASVMDGRSRLNDSGSWWLEVMARRNPGLSTEQTAAALNVLYQRIARQKAGAKLSAEAERELAHERMALLPAGRGLSGVRDRFSQPLLILMALAGVLLLIACANIASLALARATVRQKEMAARAALGAGRLRLLQQLLTENLLLAGLGGIVGLLFAYWGDNLLLKLISTTGTPLVLDLRPDARIFLFTAGVTLLAGLLFGSAPAWGAARINLNEALKASARTLASGGGAQSRWGMRKLIVTAEVAMSLLLLVGAGMLTRSLQKLREVEPGFDQAHVLLASVDPTLTGYRGARLMNLYKELAGAVSTVPGVRSASLSALPPVTSAQWQTAVFVHGRVPGPNETTNALMNMIGPDFFGTLRVPLLQGRDFTARDDANAPLVAIINETMAHFYFGQDSPIGRRLSFQGPESGEIEIVGVARDIKHNSLREAAPRVIYVPYLQTPPASLPFGMIMEISTAGDPEKYSDSVRDAMRAVASDLPILGFITLADRVNRSLGQERLVAELSGFFSLLALLLASVGLYGVMAYTVTRRTSEIGIRAALGAQRSDVLWMVLRDALWLVAVGAGCGILLALAFIRLISSQLYGISPYDPWTVCLAVALLGSIAAIASYFPARRASRVDPMVALRYE